MGEEQEEKKKERERGRDREGRKREMVHPHTRSCSSKTIHDSCIVFVATQLLVALAALIYTVECHVLLVFGGEKSNKWTKTMSKSHELPDLTP